MKKGLVFLLWGKFAQSKQSLIDETKHHVLKAAHPSPFSVDKGFYGCKHFSKTNELLMLDGQSPIDWKLLTP
jgi:uracil-DNA glycosylase